MNMFGFFKSKPKITRMSDRVWCNRAACLRGIRDLVSENSQAGLTTLLVGFFETTLQELKADLESRQVAFHEIVKGNEEDLKLPAQLFCVDGNVLENSTVMQRGVRELSAREKLRIVFIEHHPSFLEEEQLIKKLASEDGSAQPVAIFFASLDDALVRSFGSGEIKKMILKLGMREDECIENTLITRSLESAQKSIDRKVISRRTANSPEAWIKSNVR